MKKPRPVKSAAEIMHGMEFPQQFAPSVAGPTTTPPDSAPETWEQGKARQAQERGMKRFVELCPPLYRQTDPARLPARGKLAEVMAWKYGPNGLLLVGPTGTGKTRCAWLLMRRLILEDCRRVTYFDGIGWGIEVAKEYGQPETTGQWLDRVCRAEILFLDDLFKAKMTEAQEQALYGVFDRRAAWQRPTIATMNSTGDMILARMTETGRADRGEALLRRMREFCEVVTFGLAAAALPATVALP